MFCTSGKTLGARLELFLSTALLRSLELRAVSGPTQVVSSIPSTYCDAECAASLIT